MKFGLFFANAGPFANPELFEVLVRGADDVGIESIWAVEHVVVPVGYRSRYPYSEDGRMPGPENSPIPDPILALTYAAANDTNTTHTRVRATPRPDTSPPALSCPAASKSRSIVAAATKSTESIDDIAAGRGGS